MKRIIGAILLTLTIVNIFSLGETKALAATKTYGVSISRGVKYLCYSKDTITWKSNGTKITCWEGEQTRSGILVELKGITKKKTLSTSKKYALLCKHTLLIGAELNGITLGWNTDVNDMIYIYNTGNSTVTWDY